MIGFEQWNKRRAVLDTNVLVSALLSKKGNPSKILNLFLEGELLLIHSLEIFREYEDVIYRPHLQIPTAEANHILSAIRLHSREIKVIQSSINLVDEDDRVFYDVALEAEAYLITGNIKHFPNEPFVLTPAAFLELK